MFNEKYPKVAEAYTELSDLVSPKGQYSNYRKALHSISLPVIPFLGKHM